MAELQKKARKKTIGNDKKIPTKAKKDEGIVINIDDSRKNNPEEEKRRQQENVLKMQEKIKERKKQEESKKIKEKSKKKEKKKTEKKQPQQESKANKNEKKSIEINLGSIICILIIIGLLILNVVLGIKAFKVTKEKFATEEEKNNSVQETNISTSEEKYENEEVGRVINFKDELATDIVERLTFAPYVTASIYNSGGFTTETIQNDLILRVGWSRINSEDKNQEQSEGIVTSTADAMKLSVQETFGTDIIYTDRSFQNIDISKFSNYSENIGIINYSDGIYKATISNNIGNESPIIYQEIQKIVQYSKKIKVYVKTAFLEVSDGGYTLYKEFDDVFYENIMKISKEKLFKDNSFDQYTGEGTVVAKDSSNIEEIKSRLNTYVYTFELDEFTGEYYLSEFNEENK